MNPDTEPAPDYADEHAGGQLRLGAAGDQLELMRLDDARIPSTSTPPAELERGPAPPPPPIPGSLELLP